MNRIIIASALTLFCAATLDAQTFNPKVVVTNAYEGKLMEVHKQGVQMDVPDSLLSFDYNLDYSVFDNPYKGSYEFHPYLMDMKPDPSKSDAKNLYFSVGAGYNFCPELDFVLSPSTKSRFKFSVYDTFRGYYGDYNSFSGNPYFNVKTVTNGSEEFIKGNIFNNKVGAHAAYSNSAFRSQADVSYSFLASKDDLLVRNRHSVDADLSAAGDNLYDSGIFAEAALKFNFSVEDDLYGSRRFAPMQLYFKPEFKFGSVVGESSLFDVSIAADIANYSGMLDSRVMNLNATPAYHYSRGILDIDAGVKVSWLLGKDNTDYSQYIVFDVLDKHYMHLHKSSIFYPDVHAKVKIFRQYVSFFADVTGGDNINTMSSIVDRYPLTNQRLTLFYLPVMDSSTERLNASAGFSGSFLSRLTYRVKAGYVINYNALCDAVLTDDNTDSDIFRGMYNYVDYNMFHAGADLRWKSKALDIEGSFTYRKTDIFEKALFAVAPPSYSARLRIEANKNERLYGGVCCSFNSGRRGYTYLSTTGELKEMQIPYTVDLGAFAEFKLTSLMSVWLRASNILAQPVQQYFLISERGPVFTAGVCVNL